jgi:hypothetical protein
VTWTQANGVFTHEDTDRTVWLVPNAQPSSSTIRAAISDRADGVFVVLFSSLDGGTCLEVGVSGANIVWRKRKFGVVDGSSTNTGHLISAGEPFYLNVRVENGLVHADVSASGFPSQAITPFAVPSTLAGFSAWGLSSEIDDAVVTSLELSERIPVISEASDRLIVACGGDIWQSTSDTAFVRTGIGSFSSNAQPSFAEFDGLVYGVDGGRGIVVDAVNRTVFPWGRLIDPDAAPTDANTDDWDDDVSGYFPGSTTGSAGEHLKGTTDATVVCTFNRRIYVANGRTLAASAIDAPHDFLYGQNATISEDGGAFLDGGWRDPIVGMWVTPQNALVVGCTRSIWLITGDPIDGTWTKQPLSLSVGVSGINAAHVGVGLPIIVHTPEGVQQVGIDGTPIPLSAPVLTEEIQYAYDDRDTLFVTVVRDPQRYGLHLFITPRDGSVRRGFWYDERIGQYVAVQGGWFPDLLPSGMQPTCAAIWKGVVVFGCLDGFIRKFDPTKKTDDGAAIADILTSQLIDPYGIDSDTVVHSVEMELAAGTDFPAVRFYGGFTAEAAYGTDSRELLWSSYVQNGERKVVGRRAGAVVAELKTQLGNRRYVLEGLAIDADSAGRLRRAASTTATPARGCGVAAALEPDPEVPDFPDGGGGGGGGEPDPDCTGEGCEHADETLTWLSVPAAAGGYPVPTLECCCATDGSPVVDVFMSRDISHPGFLLSESASGVGTIGTLIQCDATGTVGGVTTSGYTIDLTVNCGMDVVWADNEDKRGFVDFVLAAGGVVDDEFEDIEVLSVNIGQFQVSCDAVLLSWVIDYELISSGLFGKAQGVVRITIAGREGSCST